jgi:hypothetical protein
MGGVTGDPFHTQTDNIIICKFIEATRTVVQYRIVYKNNISYKRTTIQTTK